MTPENHVEPFIKAIADNVESLERTAAVQAGDLKEFATKYLADSDVLQIMTGNGELIGVVFLLRPGAK